MHELVGCATAAVAGVGRKGETRTAGSYADPQVKPGLD